MAVSEDIFLRVDRYRVLNMTKSLPELKRGELPIKIHVEVDDSAFGKPTIEFTVRVTDPYQGVDLSSLEITRLTLSQEEFDRVIAERVDAMRELLRARGDTVIPAEPPGKDADWEDDLQGSPGSAGHD